LPDRLKGHPAHSFIPLPFKPSWKEARANVGHFAHSDNSLGHPIRPHQNKKAGLND
jgi:hypothetical protein